MRRSLLSVGLSVGLSAGLLVSVACGPPPPSASTNTTTTTSTSASESSTGDGDGAPTTETTVMTSSSTSTDDGMITGFVPGDDFGWGDSCMCDPWAQDCAEGEKCVPSSFDLDTDAWGCQVCVPITGNLPPGSPCSYENPHSPTDGCAEGSFCWNAHEADGLWVGGVCTPFCTGTPDDPICPPELLCLVADEGSVTLCLPPCDPLQQDCADSEACVFENTGFFCVYAHGLQAGDPCATRHDCAAGLQCVDAAELPACDGEACCTPICALDVVDPQCDATPGSECVAPFEPGAEPLGGENVGWCMLP